MKKRLIMILAMSICMFLCACGSSEGTSGDNTDTTIENNDVENTIEKEVEITTDNWDEYFEFRTVVSVSEDAFGEFGSADIVEGLFLKEDVKDKVKSIKDIAIEFYCSNVQAYEVEYNLNTQELVKEVADEEVANIYIDVIGRFVAEETTDILQSMPECNLDNSIDRFTYLYDFKYELGEDNILRGSALFYTDKECTRAKGTIIILE